MSRSSRPVFLAALATLAMASAARAGTFITVATVGQTIPNDSGHTFESFENDPGVSTDGADVVFTGADAVTGYNGIFDYNIANQTLTTVLLAGTTSPDGALFNTVGFPEVSNGLIAFNGITNNNTAAGGAIYTVSTTGTGLATLIGPTVIVPGSSPSTFGTITNQSGVSGSTVVVGGGVSSDSLFTSTYTGTSPGTLTLLKSGGGNNLQFSSISGTTVAYESDAGSISTINANGTGNATIVNTSSGAPSIGGTFSIFNPEPPVTDSSHVVFEATNNSSHAGLFMYPVGGGTGIDLVTSTTQAPGQANGVYLVPSTTATGYEISNGIVAFNSETSNGGSYGIYSYNVSTGAYSLLVGPGTTYSTSPAVTFTYASLLGEGIANGIDEITFEGVLSTGTIGIFIDPVAVPEPDALGMIGVSSLLILRRSRSAGG